MIKKVIKLISRGWEYYNNWRAYYLSFFILNTAKADITIFVIVFFAILFAVGPLINEYISSMDDVTKDIIESIGEKDEIDNIEKEKEEVEGIKDKEEEKGKKS